MWSCLLKLWEIKHLGSFRLERALPLLEFPALQIMYMSIVNFISNMDAKTYIFIDFKIL
jgi:hypothetical protein